MSSLTADGIDRDFVPRRAPFTHTVEIDGEAVVLDEEQNRLHRLNSTGAIVWACCDGTSTVAEIAHDLADATGIAGHLVLADVLALTRSLASQGLLDGVDGDRTGSGEIVSDVEVSEPPRIPPISRDADLRSRHGEEASQGGPPPDSPGQAHHRAGPARGAGDRRRGPRPERG